MSKSLLLSIAADWTQKPTLLEPLTTKKKKSQGNFYLRAPQKIWQKIITQKNPIPSATKILISSHHFYHVCSFAISIQGGFSRGKGCHSTCPPTICHQGYYKDQYPRYIPLRNLVLEHLVQRYFIIAGKNDTNSPFIKDNRS